MKRILFRSCFAILFVGAGFVPASSAQSYLSTTAHLALDFYQQVMSPVRHPAGHCQFEPSCSQFAKEAIHQYGPIKGTLLAADRLMRCGTDATTREYPTDGKLFLDPPEENYLFGKGGMWKLGWERTPNSGGIDSVSPKLQFPFSLYRKQQFDYSVIELERIQSTSSAAENNYLNALISIDYLALDELPKARHSIDLVEPASLSPSQKLNAFLLDYLIADRETLDSWNASRCRDALMDSSFQPIASVLSAFQVYSLAKAEAYDSAALYARPFHAESLVRDVEDAGNKSPTLAATLAAVLPGTGYVYAGRFGEGISALTFNGLLGWGIYSLFKNHNTGSGILLSTITLPFYLGNIVGSYNAAASSNARDQELARGVLRHTLQLDFYFSTAFFDRCWQ
ncbi:MAG TPA: membrane protein insertion efficiency factor YidD [Candidatus Kapabacteria bacterium]|jgi:putative component of membrane protein insertase Oxa1/YidC/SpoIIIJ protein YidD